MRHRIHLVLALLVGACAGSSTSLVAEPAPEPTDPPEPSATEPVPAGTVVRSDQAELRIAPNDKGSVRLLARGDNAFVGRLELDPLAEIPKHRDPTEEYIVVIEGGGTLLMDGNGYQLEPGSAVFMPADAEVSFANGPNKLVALQVFAGPESADKYERWKPAGSAAGGKSHNKD